MSEEMSLVRGPSESPLYWPAAWMLTAESDEKARCLATVTDELAARRRRGQEYSALSARLAACEERCKELEAGIEAHRSSYIRQTNSAAMSVPEEFKELWSLLAPKAGGEGKA